MQGYNLTKDNEIDNSSGTEISGDFSILVAEDNDINYRLIQILLRKLHLTRAENGVQAVEIVRNNHFDLVLMDVRMPVMNGLEAIRRIRAFNTEVPIIALTADGYELRQEAYEVGCDDFIVKPIMKEDLFNHLRKFLIRR